MEEKQALARLSALARNRVTVFTALPMRSISALALQTKLREIGRMEGASPASKKAS